MIFRFVLHSFIIAAYILENVSSLMDFAMDLIFSRILSVSELQRLTSTERSKSSQAVLFLSHLLMKQALNILCDLLYTVLKRTRV